MGTQTMILRTHLILPLLFLATIAAAATPQRRHAAVPPVAETSEDLIADAVPPGRHVPRPPPLRPPPPPRPLQRHGAARLRQHGRRGGGRAVGLASRLGAGGDRAVPRPAVSERKLGGQAEPAARELRACE